MHRIIIDVYEHTSDIEADEFVRDIRTTFQPSGGVRAERFHDRSPTSLEVHAREKLWRAVQNEERVELSRDEAAALWQTILNDARFVAAIRG